MRSMANTFSCLNIHCVFSTKERVRVLNPDIRERLWPYIGDIATHRPAARTSSDTNLSRSVFSLKKHGRTFRREIPLGLAAPDHTVPYGTVLSRDTFPGTSCQRHFVPGYDRCCPYGTLLQTFRNNL